MNKQAKLFVAFILVLAGAFGEQGLEFLKNINVVPQPTPVVIVEEPSEPYKSMVEDIVSVKISKNDSQVISTFFLELASVIETDPGFLKTTGQFYDFNTTAGGLNFSGLGLKDKYPTLGESIDTALAEAIGKENVQLDDGKRKSLVSVLRAVSWGVNQ